MSKLSRNSGVLNAAIAQSVERILGKDEVASSNLASSSITPPIFAAIAQPVERILGKDEVASSNLASSSKNRQASIEDCRFLLVTYSLFTLHYNLVADFWKVIGNSEQ